MAEAPLCRLCCLKFIEQVRADNIEQDQDSDGAWAIKGCCGGCYVVIGMKFCPYCGTRLPELEPQGRA